MLASGVARQMDQANMILALSRCKIVSGIDYSTVVIDSATSKPASMIAVLI